MKEIEVVRDGLPCETIKDHSLDKYRLIAHYVEMFTRAMRSKYKNLVYIDLFASYGKATDPDGQWHAGTPFIALNSSTPFDRYIFCEAEHERFSVLKTRTQKEFPNVDAVLLNIDANDGIEKVVRALPAYDKQNPMLSLCVVDPYCMDNISFDTIRRLSFYRMDFIILLWTSEFKRNADRYSTAEYDQMDKYLGDTLWREEWIEAQRAGCSRRKFLVDAFSRRMEALGYQQDDAAASILISGMGVRLYDVKIFSKHPLGLKFAKASYKGTNDQGSLFD